MLKLISIVCILYAGISFVSPASIKGSELRYQYASDSDGQIHLVDSWNSLSDFANVARYNPARSNVYHLFTSFTLYPNVVAKEKVTTAPYPIYLLQGVGVKNNPSQSQPLLINNENILRSSNYDSSRRTVVLIHGWMNSATSNFNNVLVPVLLAAEDLNIIVLDWSRGANVISYREVNLNCILSGEAVAEFIQWLNEASGSTLDQYHIIGHGVGGHQAGIIGRNLNGQVAYITGLDPALIGWVNNIFKFQPDDGLYTEVIHTNYGVYGYLANLGQVDFYPNGGISMPGCNSNSCDHERGFFYLAESITSGGFTGRECLNYYAALLRLCEGSRRLQMGGLIPKSGESGVFLLETNSSPPFSQG